MSKILNPKISYLSDQKLTDFKLSYYTFKKTAQNLNAIDLNVLVNNLMQNKSGMKLPRSFFSGGERKRRNGAELLIIDQVRFSPISINQSGSSERRESAQSISRSLAGCMRSTEQS